MQLLTRLYRTYRVAVVAAQLWFLYVFPKLARRLMRRPPRSAAELTQTHEQASQVLLDLAFDLRGVIIKVCQHIATRSDRFPPSFIERLKLCHDAVPPLAF